MNQKSSVVQILKSDPRVLTSDSSCNEYIINNSNLDLTGEIGSERLIDLGSGAINVSKNSNSSKS